MHQNQNDMENDKIIAAIAAYLEKLELSKDSRVVNSIAAEIAAAIMTTMRPEKQETPTSDLLKQFEATGYAGWINSDAEGDYWIYTREYTQWLEQKLIDSEYEYNNAIIEELSTYETLESIYDVTELAMLICARVNPA